MKYSIVYSSKSGNTELLARTIKETLDPQDCIYFGPVSEKALEADKLYIGFWTDKGQCDDTVALLLKNIKKQEVFLFGTCGFGGGQDYFDQILNKTMKYLNSDVNVIGTYMCQGKMPMTIRDKYVSMKKISGMEEKMESMIANFDQALSHPDQEDLNHLISLL